MSARGGRRSSREAGKETDGLTASVRARDWPAWVEPFLVELRAYGNITRAAKVAHVSRPVVYERRDNDVDFAEAMADALDAATDGLEAEARRRAVEGCAKPVYQGGELVGTVQEYSDVLLVTLLKAHRPEKFRERYDVTSAGQRIGTLAAAVEAAHKADADDGE